MSRVPERRRKVWGQRLSEIYPQCEAAAAAGSRKLRAADKAADGSDKQPNTCEPGCSSPPLTAREGEERGRRSMAHAAAHHRQTGFSLIERRDHGGGPLRTPGGENPILLYRTFNSRRLPPPPPPQHHL